MTDHKDVGGKATVLVADDNAMLRLLRERRSKKLALR